MWHDHLKTTTTTTQQLVALSAALVLIDYFCSVFCSCFVTLQDAYTVIHVFHRWGLFLLLFFHHLSSQIVFCFSFNCRIAEYHLKQYESAQAAFTQGHRLDGECSLSCPWGQAFHHPSLCQPPSPCSLSAKCSPQCSESQGEGTSVLLVLEWMSIGTFL